MKESSRKLLVLSTVGVLGMLGILGVQGCSTPVADSASPQANARKAPPKIPTKTPPKPTAPGENAVPQVEPVLESQLQYLVEEEKLAHDAYVTLLEKYGSNVFRNISSSEVRHQEIVAGLMEDRDIADPRTSQTGVFVDKELQALYDQLMQQGAANVTEAFRVGVAIEERDIDDIAEQLKTATDPAVVQQLEYLRSASENHLRAFNRQLDRVA